METINENLHLVEVYAKKIAEADKTQLPELFCDVAEARDDDLITAEQYRFLLRLRDLEKLPDLSRT